MKEGLINFWFSLCGRSMAQMNINLLTDERLLRDDALLTVANESERWLTDHIARPHVLDTMIKALGEDDETASKVAALLDSQLSVNGPTFGITYAAVEKGISRVDELEIHRACLWLLRQYHRRENDKITG